MPDKKDALFVKAVRRAGNSPFFMSGVLAVYSEANGMDNKSLALYLSCKTGALTRLALCRKPSTESGKFYPEIERIAEYTGADPVRLAALIREADVLSALKESSKLSGATGILAAARDKNDIRIADLHTGEKNDVIERRKQDSDPDD